MIGIISKTILETIFKEHRL